MSVKGLKCRECGRKYEAGALNRCEVCFGTLEVDYNYGKIKKLVTRNRIRKRAASIWRYQEFLPVSAPKNTDLSAGFTPLLRAERLGAALGIKHLFIKNDTTNPTFSSKDRMVAVAVAKAIEMKYQTLACASTGNLAHSLAAHAARAGIESVIFLPDSAEKGKVDLAGLYKPKLLTVRGGTSDLNRLCGEIMETMPWAFVNVNLRAYYAEGAKTLGHEIIEQMGWNDPNHIIAPVGSGTTLVQMKKGMDELEEVELTRRPDTTFHAVQAAGCAPVVKSFETGDQLVHPVKPDTKIKSLAVGNPADGAAALDIIRRSRGTALGIADDEMLEGVELLARTEGIFAEPACGAVVMAAKKLADQKVFKTPEVVVLVICGHGLKAPETIESISSQPFEIDASIESLKVYMDGGLPAASTPAPEESAPNEDVSDIDPYA